MAFFLALIAQEVFEALMPGGALHTWRRWGLPVIGALGGVAGSLRRVYLVLRQPEARSRCWRRRGRSPAPSTSPPATTS